MGPEPRLLLLQDGRCLGCFLEQASPAVPSSSTPATWRAAVVLMEPSGALLSVVDNDGVVRRHMTRFPLSTLSKKVKAVLEFRNRHSLRPYLVPCFSQAAATRADARPTARWEEEEEEEEEAVRGSTMDSLDGKANISLAPHKHLARLRFLAEVSGEAALTSGGPASAAFLTWVEQEWPVDRCPPAFRRPLTLLIGEDVRQDTASLSTPAASVEYETTLPRALPVEGGPEGGTWTALAPGTGLLPLDVLGLCCDVAAEEAGAAGLPGHETGARVVLEENELGTFWVLTAKRVGCQVKADGSWLEVEGGFVRHVGGGQQEEEEEEEEDDEERLYDAEAAANIRVALPAARPDGTTRCYSLGPLVAHCLALLTHAQAIEAPSSGDMGAKGCRQPTGEPGELVEQVEVPGLGLFRAFSNGRVRVRYEDRTILELDRHEAVCHLLLPDAVAVDLPLDRVRGAAAAGPDAPLYARYGAPAVQFLSWAFLTIEEREQAAAKSAEMARRIRHEVHRTRVHVQLHRMMMGQADRSASHAVFGVQDRSAFADGSVQGVGGVPAEAFYTPPRASSSSQRGRQSEALAVLSDVTERNRLQMESVKAFLTSVSDQR